MRTNEAPLGRLLARIDRAWAELQESYAGLSDAQLVERGVAGDWSVKDILAHITTWEEESLKYLPLILRGGRPPRYATTFGGIDAFNAQMASEKQNLTLAEVRAQLNQTHRRLVDFVKSAPAEPFTDETRARRRLRLDAYGHYAEHARAIREWRQRREGQTGSIS